MKRKIAILCGLLGIVGLVGFGSYLSTVPIRTVGPFYTTAYAFDSATGQQVGGWVQTYLAADTVWTGQYVAMTANRAVKASATLTDYNKSVGVAVGGTQTSMKAALLSTDTFTIAALPNQKVLVLRRGRTWVLDSAGGPGITGGTLVGPALGSAGARNNGRIKALPAIIDSFYRVLGRSVDTVQGGKAGLIDVSK